MDNAVYVALLWIVISLAKASPRSVRAVELYDPSGKITSPGYPNGYDSESDASWRLRVPGAEHYTIYFDTVDLDVAACYDFIMLYDDTNYFKPGVEICDAEEPYVMETSRMTISFITASDWTAGARGIGFSLFYVASGPGIIDTTTSTKPPLTPTTTEILTSTITTTVLPTVEITTSTNVQPTTPTTIEFTTSTTVSPTDAPTLSTTTTKVVQTTEKTTNKPSGNFPPGSQDDSQCGQPATAPVITGFDYISQGNALSYSARSVPSQRVVNGEEVVPHSWPWQASLRGSARGNAYCGGTLVQPQWVVTAAHCAALVFIGTYSSDQVLLGAHDKRTIESSAQLIDIIEKYSHPSYDRPDRSHDIALVKLKRPAILNEAVSLACEAHPGWSFPAGMHCVITGWGVTREGGTLGTNILQQATVPLMSDEDCFTLYQEANLDTTSDMQCAGGQGKGACNGDSGGPLNCYVNDRWYHMGIVSFGEANCNTDIASVYAKVAELRSFVDSTIDKYS